MQKDTITYDMVGCISAIIAFDSIRETAYTAELKIEKTLMVR